MIPRFRAWNKSTKVMYDDGDIVDVDIEKKEILVKTTSYKRLSYSFLGDVELMASTGFRDNDGKEIFRGDIVMSRCGLFKGIVSLITLEYRTKGEVGRNKVSVKRALYTALAMGL